MITRIQPIGLAYYIISSKDTKYAKCKESKLFFKLKAPSVV